MNNNFFSNILNFFESPWDLLFLLAYIVIGFPIIIKAVKHIFNGKFFDENSLMTIASIAAIIIGKIPEALAVMALYRVGEALQDKAIDNSRKSISSLVDIRPEFANLKQNNKILKVEPRALKPNDTIIVKSGEKIPVDGVVLNGNSKIDTSALTGESLPVDVTTNNQVLSGSINIDGLLEIKVTKTADKSSAQQILNLVENSDNNKANAQNFITKFAKYYTPIVCAVAICLAVIPSIITGMWNEWIRRAVIMLVISCPCALVISIPLGFFAGIGGASKKGILIKGGNYLEALSSAKTFIFDKTSTLTKGTFTIVAIHPEKISKTNLLKYATYAESFSNHPIAKSLEEKFGENIDKAKITDVKEYAGKGVIAKIEGHKVACGNEKFMLDQNIQFKKCRTIGTIVHIAIDGVYAGHIVISDVIKENMNLSLEILKKLGAKKLVMLTGDKEEVAKDVYKKIPALDTYMANCLPNDKLDYVNKILNNKKNQNENILSKKDTVVFIGDGINDTPSLKASDVGIAMGKMGTAAAIEVADIVFMNDNANDINLCVKIAKKTMNVVKQNIVLSLGVKFSILFLAVFGMSSIWLAEFADVGVCLLAILNSMRALKTKTNFSK